MCLLSHPLKISFLLHILASFTSVFIANLFFFPLTQAFLYFCLLEVCTHPYITTEQSTFFSSFNYFFLVLSFIHHFFISLYFFSGIHFFQCSFCSSSLNPCFTLSFFLSLYRISFVLFPFFTFLLLFFHCSFLSLHLYVYVCCSCCLLLLFLLLHFLRPV